MNNDLNLGQTKMRGEEDARSTTRSEFNIALSTISGPQTSFAPCFKAKSLVGTRDTEMRIGKWSDEVTYGHQIEPLAQA